MDVNVEDGLFRYCYDYQVLLDNDISLKRYTQCECRPNNFGRKLLEALKSPTSAHFMSFSMKFTNSFSISKNASIDEYREFSGGMYVAKNRKILKHKSGGIVVVYRNNLKNHIKFKYLIMTFYWDVYTSHLKTLYIRQ
jgi:pantoate kinase